MSEPRTRKRALQVAIILCLTAQALPASNPRLPLEKAAHTGDLERTKILLAEKQSQDVRNSALAFAIQAGHRDVMELLIAHGARYALVKAAEKGDMKLVRHLLPRGEAAGDCDAAFHAAVRTRHKEIAQLLLAHGADVDTRRFSKMTPLFFAVTGQRNTDLERWLDAPFPRATKIARYSLAREDIVDLLIKHGADVNAQGGSSALAPLYYAIHNGDKKIVETLLAHGAQVNPQIQSAHLPSEHTTPLHLAADDGDLPIATLLIEHGANVNAQAPPATATASRNTRQTPLHHAAASGNAQLVELLLDHGAQLNALDAGGKTPLHRAIQIPTRRQSQRLSVVEVLLSHNPEVNTTSHNGQTPLHAAAMCRDPNIVRRLLEHGAKPNRRDSRGRTPTSIALRNGSSEIVKLLAARLDRAALHSAASMGDIETMATLLESGVHIDRIDVEGYTALHTAVQAASLPAVQWLLDHRANPTASSDHDDTPLSIALELAQIHSDARGRDNDARRQALLQKQRQIMTLLVSHGAAPDFAWGLPQETVSAHPRKVVDLLLKAGFSLSPHHDDRATLLHRAAWWGMEKVVADLLELGADVHATDEMGATPLHAATKSGSTGYWDVISGPHVNIMEMLIEHGAQVNATNNAGATALHGAAFYDDPNAITLLTKHGADLNATDDANRTPLHIAALNRCLDVMQVLLANGADPNIADNDGNTPLLLLLAHGTTADKKSGQIKVLATDLIRRGAHVDAQNKQGVTPLHYAAAGGYPDLLEEMLRRGAPINAQSTGGWTALHGAVAAGDIRCTELLIERGALVNGPGRPPGSMHLRGYSWGTQTRTPIQIGALLEQDPIVQLLIDAGADVNATGTDHEPPLYLVYRQGRHATFQLLLARGAAPNIAAPNGIPLVYVAAARQKRQIVDALLQHGARADADLVQTLLETGTTPLHTAAREGDLDRVNELLAKGAKADVSDKRGRRPIHHAHAERHIDIVKRLLPETPTATVTDLLFEEIDTDDRAMIPLLLAHGADVNAKNPRYMGTLLHWLVWRADAKTIELFLNHGVDVNTAGGASETALTRAVMGKRKDVVALLLAHGADCSITPTASYTHYRGRTPLHVALSQGSFDIATMLVEAGADAGARTSPEQFTPLHMAISDRTLFELMLAHGAPIDACSFNGRTPLHIAADKGRTDDVAYLLDKGASVNARDNAGNTALHLAARKGHSATCKLLLDRQADITIRTQRGRLPLDYARAAELDDLVPHLTPPTPNAPRNHPTPSLLRQ